MKRVDSGYIFADENIHCLITTKEVDAKNIEHIKKILTSYSFSGNSLQFVNQVHGTDIKIIAEDNCKLNEFDALVTNKVNMPLMIFTADCVPLIFYDKKRGVIGLAHAGWKGTYANIAGKVVNLFRENYDSRVEDIQVIVGPHITKENYEVSKELIDKFSKLKIKNYYIEKNNKYYLDLLAVNNYFLQQEGIVLANIKVLNLCTFTNNDEFFSYRKDNGTTKRIGTIIEIRR